LNGQRLARKVQMRAGNSPRRTVGCNGRMQDARTGRSVSLGLARMPPFGVSFCARRRGAELRFGGASKSYRARRLLDATDSGGQTREQLRALDGKQPGDPERAVRAMIQAVESDDPPRRLALGGMALEHIRAHLRDNDELEKWATLSATSDSPGKSAA
jgi:hypothetical protein